MARFYEAEFLKVRLFWHCNSDEDECQISTDNCSDNANCINTEGSFNCSCKPGYMGDGQNCSGQSCKIFSLFSLIN